MALLRLYLTQLRAQQATAQHKPPAAKSTTASGTTHATTQAPCVEPSRSRPESDPPGASTT